MTPDAKIISVIRTSDKAIFAVGNAIRVNISHRAKSKPVKIVGFVVYDKGSVGVKTKPEMGSFGQSSMPFLDINDIEHFT